MLFPQVYLFFLAGSFQFSSHSTFLSTHTISVAQGLTATPGATKQLLPLDMVFKKIIHIYARSTKSRNYIVCLSSFLVQFAIFKNAFTLGRWYHYALTVTVSGCYIITREWWFHVHFIHAEDFSLSTKSNLIQILLWSNCASAFSVLILTFLSVSIVYSVVFLCAYLFYAFLHQTTPDKYHI